MWETINRSCKKSKPPYILGYLYYQSIAVQHIEFFHVDHFEDHYYRVKPAAALQPFIDFFWETNFDSLWPDHPDGFSDLLFPNTGYTYLINLGTPFTMRVNEDMIEMKTDGFLPRHKSIECFHRQDNKLMGIKFRISPMILKNRINFAEYREFIYPLTYLMEKKVMEDVKKVGSFTERAAILEAHFLSILETYSGSWEPIKIVAEILEKCNTTNDFSVSIESLSAQYGVSTRTLQRYFEASTSLSSKKAMQVMRIRKAVNHMVQSPGDFHYSIYGYYDRSHFYKHMKTFLGEGVFKKIYHHLLSLGKSDT